MRHTRRRVLFLGVFAALLLLTAPLWFRAGRQSAVAPIPSPPKRPTPQEKSAAPTIPEAAGNVPPKPPDPEIFWKNLHPALKFRFYFANELPYRSYEEWLLQLEAMTGSRLPKSHVESVTFVSGVDSKIWALVNGLDPVAQRKILMDLASGIGTMPEGVEPEAARVRSLMLLWKAGPDEQLLPALNNLAITDPDPNVRTGAAVLMAHWGEVERVGHWLREASMAQAEDFLAPLAVGTNSQMLSIPERIRSSAVEPMGSFSPDLATALLEKLGTTDSRTIQARLITFLKLAGENEKAARHLLQQGDHPDVSLRNISLGSLGRALSNPRVEEELLEILKGPDSGKARAVLPNFRFRLAEERRVAAILPLLQAQEGAYGAIEILETAPFRHLHLVIPALNQAAATHADASIREKARKMAETLSKRKPPPVQPPR